MTIQDKFRNIVLEFARNNYGQYPEFILCHPLSFQELITDLHNYTSMHQDLNNFKFMGCKIIKSLDIEKDTMMYESIIAVSRKLK